MPWPSRSLCAFRNILAILQPPGCHQVTHGTVIDSDITKT